MTSEKNLAVYSTTLINPFQHAKRRTDISNLLSSRNLFVSLLLLDIAGILIALEMGFFYNNINSFSLQSLSFLFVAIGLPLLLGLYIGDTYSLNSQISGLRAPYRAMISNFIIISLLIVIYTFTIRVLHNNFYSFSICYSVFAFLFFTIWITNWRFVIAKSVYKHIEHTRWLLLGGKEAMKSFINELLFCFRDSEVVYLNEDLPQTTKKSKRKLERKSDFENILSGTIDELPLWIDQSWTGIIVAPTLNLTDDLKRQLMAARINGAIIYRFDDFCEHFLMKIPTSFLKDSWFAFSTGFALLHNPVTIRLKRLFDMFASIMLLLLSLPICIVAVIAMYIESPGPIFFTQMRTGMNRKKFRVFKLRTMYESKASKKDDCVYACKNDSRVTKVGGILRTTRINELPQLFNVLKGEMSLIGPRPELPDKEEELRSEIPYYDMRYLVKPGITGWAQIMYRYCENVNDVSVKVAYDLYYVKNYSILFDLAILLKTIRTVIFSRGL